MGRFVQRLLVRSVGAIGAIVLLGVGCSGEAATVDDSIEATVASSPVSVGEVEEDVEGGVEVEVEQDGPSGQQPEGFSTMMAQITEADGEICEVCVWLADTSDERARGLMGVTDLGDAVGMVFRFEEPIDGSFAHAGTRPHRAPSRRRTGSLSASSPFGMESSTIATRSVGARYAT